VKTKETTPEILDELLENLNYDDIDWDAKFATPEEFVKGFLKSIKFKSTIQSNSQSPYYGLSLEVASDDHGNLAAIANQYNGTVSVQLRLANKIFKETPIFSKKSRTFTLSGFTKFESNLEIQRYINDLVETINEDCFSEFIQSHKNDPKIADIDINKIHINSDLDWCYNSNNKELQIVSYKFNSNYIDFGSTYSNESIIDVRMKYNDSLSTSTIYSPVKRITLKNFPKWYRSKWLSKLLNENLNKEPLLISKECLPSQVEDDDIQPSERLNAFLKFWNVNLSRRILAADDTTGKLKIRIFISALHNNEYSKDIKMIIDGFRTNSSTANELNTLSKSLSPQDFTIIDSHKKDFDRIGVQDISTTKSFPNQKAKLKIINIDKNQTDESITIVYRLLNWSDSTIQSDKTSIKLKNYKFKEYINYDSWGLNRAMDNLTSNDLIIPDVYLQSLASEFLNNNNSQPLSINPKSPYAAKFNDVTIMVLGQKNTNDFNGTTVVTAQLKYERNSSWSSKTVLSDPKDFLISGFAKKTTTNEVNTLLNSIEAKDLSFIKKSNDADLNIANIYADEIDLSSSNIYVGFNIDTEIGRKLKQNNWHIQIAEVKHNVSDNSITFKVVLYDGNKPVSVRSSTYKEFAISGFKKR
uniref:hypothetical protein n=1 Tax=Mycoplasmopsis primatum TaxID=55604 RepID=UPI00056C1FEB